jgi:hypothetical protein
MMLGALLLATTIAVAAPAQDPADIAQREFIALSHGTVDRSQLTPRLSTALSDAEVASTASHLAPLGDLKRMGLNSTHHLQGETQYIFIMVCADDNIRMMLSFSQDGLIDYISFLPWPGGGSAPYIGPAGYGDPRLPEENENPGNVTPVIPNPALR